MNLHKHTHPKVVFILFTLPFILICPFTIIAAVTGFPITTWVNNSKRTTYYDFIENLQVPETTLQVGETYADIDNFYVAEDASEQVINEDVCDMFAVKLLQSELPSEEISSFVLNDFTTKLNSEDATYNNLDLLLGSQIILLPIDPTEDIFYQGKTVSLTEDLKLESREINNLYALIMYNLDAFESRDLRCNL